MTKIPVDDVLESLYKLRILEFDQLKTVLELYDLETHQKISMPSYRKLKKMEKRSIDLKLRRRNRNKRIETGAQKVLKKDKENAINGKQKGQCP